MTFLNPALLFGLLAASIPVLIHLLNLRKLKKIDFSTLQFLKELQKNKIRKVKIKQWLLLALRVLIILLIVTAFARPTLEGVSIGGAASSAKTTAIFIIDDTFSMSFVDQEGSYFNQAKETITKLLNQFEEGDELGLLLVSDPNNETELTTNIAKFRDDLNDVEISYATNELNNSILAAAKLLSESKNFNKEIYLFSDFQRGRLADQKNIISVSDLLNESVRLYSIDYSGANIYNLGINSLKVNTQLFEPGKPILYEAEVTNYSSQNADNLVLSLFVNGERSAQKSINLNAGETTTLELEAETKISGFQDVAAEIESDDILYDNNRYTTVFIPDKLKLLILFDEKDDVKFLDIALQSANKNERFEITLKKNNQVTASFINKFDVTILIGINNKQDLPVVKDFVIEGGGLIILPGSKDDLNSFASFLKSFDLPVPNNQISIFSNQLPFEFEKVDINHALFKNIFLDESKSQIESPQIYSYFDIKTQGKGRNIISLVDGSAFLSEYKSGKGRILLFNLSPVLNKSDFPLKSIFAPLFNKSVYYLSSKESVEANYFAGENLYVNLAGRILPQVKVIKPDKSEELININENSGSQFLSYDRSNFAGNYKFYNGDEIINQVSVNTNPLESNVNSIDESEFEEYLDKINFKGSHIRIEKDENPQQLILQARFGSELWRYFLFAALIIALIEMAVARNVKKELVELKS